MSLQRSVCSDLIAGGSTTGAAFASVFAIGSGLVSITSGEAGLELQAASTSSAATAVMGRIFIAGHRFAHAAWSVKAYGPSRAGRAPRSRKASDEAWQIRDDRPQASFLARQSFARLPALAGDATYPPCKRHLIRSP
ncbi:hypothetical protein SPHINGO391_470318 [Sphingomonas aurantiaca]|uniref:Uncharacterized protein n=1 Tax=Sphingomonas aurantiaca TaxID=185949 RepID=A0A5E7ZU21_9SPHN|nr:hypothetical protein SPHINGO391_470318 [Sphingomonas aurantiaca]